MKPLAIAAVNLRRLFRDRSNIFFVFVLPLAIIVIIGSLFGGSSRPTVGVVAEGVGPLGEQLVTAFEADDGIDVERYDDRRVLVRTVERGLVEAGVFVPAGYDDELRAGRPVTIGFSARPDGVGQQLQATVAAVAAEQGSLVRAAAFASEVTGAPVDATLETARTIDAGLPAISVETATVGQARFADLGRFDFGASSQLVLFMYLTALTGSAALIETRRLGVSRRMLSTPISASRILLGEGLGRYAVVLVQGLYIMLATLLVFRVNWGDPAGALAVIALFSAVGAGAAMLMGTLFRNDQQAGGIGVVAGLGIAALGGCMIPLEFFSPTMRMVAHATPHAWALDAFSELVRSGGTIADIGLELAVLAGYAAVLIAVASWRLRTVLTRT